MTPPTTTDEIRKAYLDFFAERGHLVAPSSSLIPAGDPTLLLTSAGMVQFKPYFSGEAEPPNPRLASSQKCFRTTDIENVGDTKHLTFFEMLGNFSIGDYFKKEAIAWSWEFVTEVLELPEERLWVSIYLDDDEAEGYWREIGVPAERIVRYGDEDNFWGPAGEGGPVRPVQRDPLRLRRGVRGRPHARRQRRAVRRDLEPRLHAVLPPPRRVADEAPRAQHRHRHGAGAYRDDHAGPAFGLRERRLRLPGRRARPSWRARRTGRTRRRTTRCGCWRSTRGA